MKPPYLTQQIRDKRLKEAKTFGIITFVIEWIKIYIFNKYSLNHPKELCEPIEKEKRVTFEDIFTEAKIRWDKADQAGEDLILKEYHENKLKRPHEFIPNPDNSEDQIYFINGK